MKTLQEDFREFAYLDAKRTTDGLSPHEFHRWQMLHYRLDKAFSGGGRPAGTTEQRQSLRLPTRLRVSYDGLSGQSGTVVNLSRGGCFVRTDLPAPVGTRLVLVLDATNLPGVIEAEAEVVSVNFQSNRSGRGMGLRFVHLEPEMQKLLSELYESILSFFAFTS